MLPILPGIGIFFEGCNLFDAVSDELVATPPEMVHYSVTYGVVMMAGQHH
jgi:hypothetical protein